MALLPEIIFRTVIARGIRTVRQDSRLLDQLFRNLDQESAQQMRAFIKNKEISVDVNYPYETLKLPAIIILLKSENESQAFLNDMMGINELPDSMSYDNGDGSGLEVLGGAASTSTLSGEGQIVFGPQRAASSTNNTLTIDSRLWVTDQLKTGGTKTVHIINGRGVGQRRTITANSQNVLMVDENWKVNPDSSSVFVVREGVLDVVGEPSSVYDRQYAQQIERRGSLYALSYQIQIIGPNPEFTIYLHMIIKAIFTLSRMYLEQQGIINMKLGATDFVPKTEYQPDKSYMRVLNIDFLYSFDIFEELGDLANSLRVVLENGRLEAEDEVITSPTDVLSDTTISD